MIVLVLNCGSSSVKFQLFDMATEAALLRGAVEKIGEATSLLVCEGEGKGINKQVSAANHSEAFNHMRGLLADLPQPQAVGHRVVFGGEIQENAVFATPEIESLIESYSALAPLHNPPNLAGIRAARQFYPSVPHVAAFDTSYHQTMPPRSYLYAIPYDFYEKYRIRRYGFHGISHNYVAERAARLLAIHPKDFTGITAHLGNGCSLTAIQRGQAIDTTMGMTPLEGVMMGTRSGDIDAAIIFHLMDRLGISAAEVQRILQKESGVKGVSGLSNDLREIEAAAADGHERARLTLEMYAYRVRKYIGAYLAVLANPQALIFMGGVGERGTAMRERILSGLSHVGIRFDAGRNRQATPPESEITTPDSPIRAFVIATNEELMIARETQRLAAPQA
ncbi:acetate kinase [Candidatus Sumerlaeota bacterium]|nr:acetate kinase [Candidatus Sumerlaeota bacterium]